VQKRNFSSLPQIKKKFKFLTKAEELEESQPDYKETKSGECCHHSVQSLSSTYLKTYTISCYTPGRFLWNECN
jgi:hypothetical protein